MLNSEEAIRKLSHNLYLGGIGVILLGFWGCIKGIMEVFFSEKGITSYEIEPEYQELFYLVMFVVLVFLVIVIASFHLYVGINAMKAGKRGTGRKLYLFVAAFLAILTLLSIDQYIDLIKEDITQIDVYIASMLVDFTFVYIICDIIYSSVKIEKLKKLRSGEKEEQ